MMCFDIFAHEKDESDGPKDEWEGDTGGEEIFKGRAGEKGMDRRVGGGQYDGAVSEVD
jgi:hypothetical protein